MLITILTYITQKNHQQAQHITALRTEITTVHHELGTIAKDLERQTGYMWKDESECYVLVKNQFGVDDVYVCEVVYKMQDVQVNDQEMRSLLGKMDVRGTSLMGIAERKDSISIAGDYVFPVETSNSGKRCHLYYERMSASNRFSGNLFCYYSIEKALYKHVLGILPEGEAR